MAREIERKFLLRDDSWRARAESPLRCVQGYLASATTCSIRVRVAGEHAWLNIKGATLGVERAEYEYPIPATDAREMLASLAVRPLIEKTRWYVRHGRHTWEIDEFEGENAGLVVAEIELASVAESFEHPAWLGEEVSQDPRYYNVRLVGHPYRRWAAG